MKNKRTWNAAQRDFYNQRDHKRMWFRNDSPFVKNNLEKFIFFIGLKPGSNVLEIGCGAGRYTIPLLQRSYQITGIDISERMLQKLDKDLSTLDIPKSQYRLFCTDLDSFQIDSSKRFDAVIGFNVLHHLFDIPENLKKISTLVKEGGQIAFLEPNGRNLLHHIDAILDRGWKYERHKFKSTPEHFGQLMSANGYRQMEYLYFGFFPPFVINYVPALLKVEHPLEKIVAIKKMLPYFIIKAVR